MPTESPTKWQAQAYRFGVRRLESAVSSGDPLLRGDPVRRRLNISIIVSFIIAVLLLGGFAVYGFIRPEPKIGDAAVVIDEDTGGVFVSRDGVLYPAMNLASALLAAGRGQSGNSAPSTTTVDTDTIAKQPRGPLLGIPGAPNVLPGSSKLLAPTWTVCDTTTVNTALPPNSPPDVHTTAIVGEPAPAAGRLGTTRAMLVSPDAGVTSFLLWDGRRSKIEPDDQTIKLAFNLTTQDVPRPISASLLNTIPEGPDIVVPSIAVPTTQPDYATALGVHVDEVFGLTRSDRTHAVYVALPDGYQQVTPLVGDLIRDYYSESKQLPLVAPELLRQAPVTSQPIDLGTYPATRPDIVGYQQAPAVCVSRSGIDPRSTHLYARLATPLPKGAKPVGVTKPGPLTVDSVYVHPGDGAVFSSTTTGETSGSHGLFVVTDQGIAYPVVSGPALVSLGYVADDVKDIAPQLLDLLPQGPALDPDAAVHFYPQSGISASSLPSPTSAAPTPSG